MRDSLVRTAIVGAALLVAVYVVVRVADGWADWVVFTGIVLTALGFAIAVAPRLYSRRRRTISRSSSEGGGS